MTKKEEINKAICSMTDDQIEDFVKKRIQELEEESVETTVGQGYTTIFREYISEKTHYRAKINDIEYPDLVYDDITPYISLIKAIKRGGWYHELRLFTTIFFVIYNYLPNDDFGFGRAFTYIANKGKRVSIKEIIENGCAFCSEKAGMAHNLFKFLGVDSEVVFGYKDSVRHTYNIVYPFGYGNEPMVIYDPSFFVSFIKDGQKASCGYFKAMGRADYEKLMSGLPVKMELSRTEKNYRQLYNLGDEYIFEGDISSYIAGIENMPTEPS